MNRTFQPGDNSSAGPRMNYVHHSRYVRARLAIAQPAHKESLIAAGLLTGRKEIK